MDKIIDKDLIEGIRLISGKLDGFRARLVMDYERAEFSSFMRSIATQEARKKRNERFNRNKKRIFRKKGGYRGYIAGETVFYKENITMTLSSVF